VFNMSTPLRLATYGAGLIAVFGLMFLAGRALVPEKTVADWTRQADESSATHEEGHESMPATRQVRGLAVEQDGYRLVGLEAPDRTGVPGRLAFRINDAGGGPLTSFAISHERDLHLIVVRSDGAGYRHVHPVLDRSSGTWSIPWTWARAGTYRVFADFVPDDREDATAVTLSGTVDVAGQFNPVDQDISRRDQAGPYGVTMNGEIEAGKTGDLTAEVTRNGQPVTGLQPYLGAMGHLVALREGDLGFLHVHPTSGLTFETEAPTPGRYLLYLDFKVDGKVRSADFVLEAK
jgi:hypothetical protein